VPSTVGCRTVVLGAGLAGSVAALVCARAGHDVVLVERDPDVTGGRPGAAHAQQLHNLLGRSQRHLTELVPGFEEALVAAGGQRAAVASQTHVFELGTSMPERDLDLQIWSARKPVIDAAVRQSLLATDVERGYQRRAEGLRVSDGRVVGVRVDDGLIDADLIIDAMGSRSPAGRWFAGEPVPAEQYIVRQWYTTMPVDRPAARIGAPEFWLTFPTYPRTRGGLVSPVDERTWHVSVSGGADDEPPRTPTEFLAYARTLEHPAIAELVAAGQPVDVPQTYHKPVATWRRFDRAPSVPSGLLSVGDAVADLNPLIGQGISVATWQLSELAALLAETDDITELTARFRERAAAVVAAAWNLTTLYDEAAGEVTLTAAEWDRIVDLVRADPAVHRRYVEVWHLLRPVAELHEIAATAVSPEAVA
jgi:flavin-dependent dehydrogenase